MTEKRFEPGRFFFVMGLGAVLITGAILARDFATGSRFFPQTVAIIGAVLCFLIAALQLILARPDGAALDASTESAPIARASLFFAGLIGYLVFVYLAGFFVATLVGLFLFLKVIARAPLRTSLIIGVLTVGTVLLLGFGLSIHWPQGIIAQFIGWD